MDELLQEMMQLHLAPFEIFHIFPKILLCNISFRVSEEEYQQLQEKISESGKNQQEYILSCVLEKQIVNTDGIKELIPELKRIGNNLNQIAKRCNEGGMLPSEAEVRKHGEELNKVWQSLRRYLQRRA